MTLKKSLINLRICRSQKFLCISFSASHLVLDRKVPPMSPKNISSTMRNISVKASSFVLLSDSFIYARILYLRLPSFASARAGIAQIDNFRRSTSTTYIRQPYCLLQGGYRSSKFRYRQ
ncbi:hypothetical protein AVEN_108006-1 [Araneus ventricosus]|uniref:Uncharacterized protein n=1 Tax=Araneus ventricosus TaxID=182803 RepID=A0A4Y2DUN8_ARAVE|nr:hypothetical protein AVEN_108006-1 [Araneus ventricosus]